jgi:hypothetical protein
MKITIKVPQEMIRVAGDRAILRGEEGEAQVHISALDNKAIASYIIEQLDVPALRAGKEQADLDLRGVPAIWNTAREYMQLGGARHRPESRT